MFSQALSCISNFSDNVPHDFQLNLEVYAVNTSIALSSSVKDFASRYSDFYSHGKNGSIRKVQNKNSVTVRNGQFELNIKKRLKRKLLA